MYFFRYNTDFYYLSQVCLIFRDVLDRVTLFWLCCISVFNAIRFYIALIAFLHYFSAGPGNFEGFFVKKKCYLGGKFIQRPSCYYLIGLYT